MFDNRPYARISDTTLSPQQPMGVAPAGQVPRTRAGSTWSAYVPSAVLIVFIGQNTRTVQVNLLRMGGSLTLGLPLLIAAGGAAILITTVGTVRITQLRRLSRPAPPTRPSPRDRHPGMTRGCGAA